MAGETAPKLRSLASLAATGLGFSLFGYSSKINVQTATAYTLVPSDTGKIVEPNNAAAFTLTLPATLPREFCCLVTQTGAGQVTLSPATGATIRNKSSFTKTSGQYAGLSLYVSTNIDGKSAVYQVFGDGSA